MKPKKKSGNRINFLIAIAILIISIMGIMSANAQQIKIEKDTYNLGEIIDFEIINASDYDLIIGNEEEQYRFLGDPTGDQFFVSEKIGTHLIQIKTKDTGKVISQKNIDIIIPILLENKTSILENPKNQTNLIENSDAINTNKETYLLGEKVVINVDNKYSDYALSIKSDSDSKLFLGNLQEPIFYFPEKEGEYKVDVYKEENTFTKTFVVKSESDRAQETNMQTNLINNTSSILETQIISEEETEERNFIKIVNSKGNQIGSQLFLIPETSMLGTSALVSDPISMFLESERINQLENLDTNKEHDFELVINDKNIENLRLYNTKINEDVNIYYDTKIDVNIAGKKISKSFSLSLPQKTMSVEIETKAKGDELWRCADWNFENEVCETQWTKIMDLLPGSKYTISAQESSVAFSETEISVLNVQSYPIVGGIWEVEFTTNGREDLIIETINGTNWAGPVPDLSLIDIKCGQTSVPYSLDENKVIIKNFYCDETAAEISKVLTTGKHHLKFTFGNQTAYANNDASLMKQKASNIITPTSPGSIFVETGFRPDFVEFHITSTNTFMNSEVEYSPPEDFGWGHGFAKCNATACEELAMSAGSGSSSTNGYATASTDKHSILQIITDNNGDTYLGSINGTIISTNESGFIMQFDSAYEQQQVLFTAYQFPAQSEVEIGTFTTKNSTGTQAITTGFKPNYLNIYTTPQINSQNYFYSSGDGGANHGWSIGFAAEREGTIEQQAMATTTYAKDIDSHVWASTDSEIIRTLWKADSGDINGRIVSRLDSFDSNGFTLNYLDVSPDVSEGTEFLAMYAAIKANSQPDIGYSSTPTTTGMQTINTAESLPLVNIISSNTISTIDTEGWSGNNNDYNHWGWMFSSGNETHQQSLGFSSHSNSVNSHASAVNQNNIFNLLYTDVDGNILGRDRGELTEIGDTYFKIEYDQITTTTTSNVRTNTDLFFYYGFSDKIVFQPNISLNSPGNSTSAKNPVTFNFTPKCLDTCDTAMLYFNQTGSIEESWTTNSKEEWDEGTTTNISTAAGSLSLGSTIYETGIVENVNGWTAVNFDGGYTDPVVIVTGQEGADISMDAEASRPRIRNIDGSGFEVIVTSDLGNSVTEDIGYIVMEKGHHTIDGVEVEAGTYTVSDTSTQIVTYNESFPGNTVMVDTMQQDCGVVASRYSEGTMGSATVSGVYWELMEGSSEDQWTCGTATAGYISVERGAFSNLFESELVQECAEDPGSSNWCTTTFTNTYTQTPILFVNPIDAGGPDATVTGRRLLSTTGVNLRPTESRAFDPEQNHAVNDIPWIVWTDIAGGGTIGFYESKIFDAGILADWSGANIQAQTPGNSSYLISYAENNSGTWSYYSSISSVPNSRYLKYNFTLLANGTDKPIVQSITINYNYTGETYEPRDTMNPVNGTSNIFIYNFENFSLPQTFRWNVEVNQTDSIWGFAENDFLVTVLPNNPPQNPSPVIYTGSGMNGSNENVSCESIILDLDDSLLNLNISWYNNSIFYTSNYYSNIINGSTFVGNFSSSLTNEGDTWLCSMQVDDGYKSSNTANSSEINIINSPPVVHLSFPLNNSAQGASTGIKETRFVFNQTESNPDNCTLKIDGQPNVTKLASQGENEFIVNISNSQIYWAVECTDSLGGTGTSQTFEFTTIFHEGSLVNLENTTITNITGLNFTTGNVSIVFNNTNLEGITDLTQVIQQSNNYASVNSETYPGFQTAANITLFNLPYQYLPIILKDSQECINCQDKQYSAGTLFFSVPGFSMYTTTQNSQLHIYDSTDPQEGLQKIYEGNTSHFFANYSNKSSNLPISGAGAQCLINFTDSSNNLMVYNSSSGLYEYSRSFSTNGELEWNVSCSAGSQGYESVAASDNLTILPPPYWGITSSAFTSVAAHSSVRCMGGISPGVNGIDLSSVSYRASAAGTLALGVYFGGSEGNPAGATKQAEILSLSASSGWNTYNLTQSIPWPADTVTWLCWKQTGASPYYSSTSADAGDFFTSHGRHDDGGGNPSASFANSLTGTSLGNFWYSIYANYAYNLPPSTPTDILCNGNSNCDIEVQTEANISATGSVDSENNNITYFVEASLKENEYLLNSTDITLEGIGGDTPVSYTDTFETGLGNWQNVGGDSADWTRDRSGTPSASTGPSIDHTLGTSSGWYMFTESSAPITSADTFLFEGPSFAAGSLSTEIDFWYHMFLGGTGNTDTLLALDIYDGTQWTLGVYNITGEQHTSTTDPFDNAVVNLSSFKGKTLTPRFRVVVGSTGTNTWQNDVAIDDIDITTESLLSGTETNSTPIEYVDLSSDYGSINSVDIQFEIETYDPRVSAGNGNNKPDLYVEAYNGTVYVPIGSLGLQSIYSGSGLQTNNEIVSINITDQSVLDAWQFSVNQDIRVKGINIDFNLSGSDQIIITNQWTNISGNRWSLIGNHSENGQIFWNVTNENQQSCVDFRSQASDLSGSTNYSEYYYENSCLKIIRGNIVNLTSPQNGFSSGESQITFKYVPEDDILDNCSLWTNSSGSWRLEVTNLTPINLQNNTFTHNFSAGEYLWNVQCYDQEGLDFFAADNRSFSVDLTPPAPFSLSTPVNGTISNNLLPSFTWQQTSDVHFDNYTLLLDKSSLFDTVDFQYYTNAITNTSITVPSSIDGNSIYYWMVKAYDEYGNVRNSTEYFKYITDNIKPNITLVTPLNNSYSTQSTVLFNFTPADNYGIDTCAVYTNFSGSWQLTASNSSIQNNANNYIVTSTPSDGYYKYGLWCNDTAGNPKFSDINRTIIVDKSGPFVSLVSPEDNYYENESNIINFTAFGNDTYSGLSNCELLVNGQSEQSKLTVDEQNVTFTEFLTNGEYNWSVKCTDVHGFSGFSAQRNVSVDVVDSDPPLVTLNYPVDNHSSIMNITFNYTPEDATGLKVCELYVDGLLNNTCAASPDGYETNPQAETGIIELTGTTNTVNLDNSYDITKSFIVRRYAMYTDDSNQEPDGGTATIEWAGCAGNICNQLTATRQASDAEDLVASYSVLQADNIRTWNFTADWSSGQNNAYINPNPDLPTNFSDKCFVNVHRSTRINSADINDFADAEIKTEISSADNISLYRYAEGLSTASPGVTSGEIVCFLDETRVQNVERVFSEGTDVTENIPIDAVDLNRAFSIYSHRQADDGVGQNSIISNITFDVNLQMFVSEDGSSGTARTPDVSAYVIEFENESQGNTTMLRISPGSSDQDITDITPKNYDLDRSLLVCYNSMAAGGGTAHTRDYWAHQFTNSNTINSINYRTRGGTQVSLVNCLVVEWPLYTTYDSQGLGECINYNQEPNYVNVSGISEGIHNWSVSCTDSSEDNNTGSSTTENFVIDLTNPTINLTSPGNDSFSSSSLVTFSYVPIDINLDRCSLYTNESGVFAQRQINASPLSNQINTFSRTLADGTYIWNVLCQDISGRSNYSNQNLSINVDTSPPQYNNIIVSPVSPTSYLEGNNYSFNITWSDNFFMAGAYIEHNMNGILQNYSMDNISSSYSYMISDVAAGSYSYKFHGFDTLGNVNSTDYFNYDINKAEPSIALYLNSSQQNISISQGDSVNITATLSLPLTGQLSVYNEDILINSGNVPLQNETYFGVPGLYNITAEYAESENFSSSKKEFFVNVQDTISPVVTLIYPNESGFVGTSEVFFDYNVTDQTAINNCSLLINGSLQSTEYSVQKNITQQFFTTLSDGNYSWLVQCYDEYDNLGQSNTYNFTLIKSDFIVVNVTSQNSYERGEIADLKTLTTDIFGGNMNTSVSSIITQSETTTGWWDTSWKNRKSITINESLGINWTDALIEVNITGLNNSITTCANEIRIIDYRKEGKGETVPRKILSGDDNNYCFVRFVANITPNEYADARFYVYYNNSLATPPTYADSLFENVLYSEDGENSTTAAEWIRNPASTDTATAGWWQWGDPDYYVVGSTIMQPEDDVTNPGVNALFTGPSGDNTGTGFSGDVDEGITTIESPSIDISGWADVNVSFYRWFASNDNGGNNDDTCALNISTDNGATYNSSLLYLNDDDLGGDPDAYNQWDKVSYSLASIISDFNDEFRMLAIGDDFGDGDVVECGFDEFIFTATKSNIVTSTGGTENFIASNSGITDGDGEHVWNWDTRNYNFGNYTIISTATRTNFTSGSAYDTFEIVPDVTPPNITLISPFDYEERGVGNTNYSYRAYDINLDKCTLYYGPDGSFEENETRAPANNVTDFFTGKFVSLGLIRWNVYCNDTQGNSGFANQNFTVNVTGPDLRPTAVWFEEDSLVEGEILVVYANITNIGLTDTTDSFIVQAFLEDPDISGDQTGMNVTVNGLAKSETKNVTFNHSAIAGPNNIFIAVDRNNSINESDESNNKNNNSFHVNHHQIFYGDVSSMLTLGAQNYSLISFLDDNDFIGNIYFSDVDSSFSFTDLQALGRNTLGNPASNDFSELDSLLGSSSFIDSVSNTWANGTNTPLVVEHFMISGSNISDVPVVNSTDTDSFITGILWDTGDDSSSNLQFDSSDQEDVVFVTKINRDALGKYGTYDYEIKVPATLRDYKMGTDKIIVHVEIK